MKTKKFDKNCPECGNKISFSSKKSLNRSIKRNASCSKCRSNWKDNLKKCSICKDYKNKDEYYKGSYSRCKECVLKEQKKVIQKEKIRYWKVTKKIIKIIKKKYSNIAKDIISKIKNRLKLERK